MKVIADLEVHSKYARAVSPQMIIPTIALWADKKGIDLVGTGDFTHPLWLRELEANLDEAGEGVYKLKSPFTSHSPSQRLSRADGQSPVTFLLTSEISCIYSHLGKGRRIHIMVFLPTFADVNKFNQILSSRGANLFSDGRPIVGLTLSQILDTALSVSPKAIVIPAHVWTPWFGFYGAKGGYDSLSEAFGESEKFIPAIETGMSSDPAMNWRIGEISGKSIVSFGDAHSPAKLGREATVFDMPEISFEGVRKAVWGEEGAKIDFTIEFYPEEGKYHYTGHRNCKVVYSPNEARKLGTICPVCGKSLTVGVMSRVEELARGTEIETESEKDEYGVRWIKPKGSALRAGGSLNWRPYAMLVPLLEVLAEALGYGVSSQNVVGSYEGLIAEFGSEFKVLLTTPTSEIEKVAGSKIAEGIAKVRSGDIVIEPGYDGIFGKVKIWPSTNDSKHEKEDVDQGTLF